MAKLFSEITKYNPYHDSQGRFSTSNGAAAFSLPRNTAHLKNPTPPKGLKVISGSGQIRPGQKHALEKQLKKVENEIRKQDYETMVAFDADGNVLMRKDGTNSSVSFTKAEAALFQGAVLTHNHPSGTCFSPEDLMTAIKNNAAEIRAAGSTGVTYSFKQVKGVVDYQNKADNFMKEFASKSNSEFPNKARDMTDDKYLTDFQSGKVDVNFMTKIMRGHISDLKSDWLNQNAPDIGWEYKRTGKEK